MPTGYKLVQYGSYRGFGYDEPLTFTVGATVTFPEMVVTSPPHQAQRGIELSDSIEHLVKEWRGVAHPGRRIRCHIMLCDILELLYPAPESGLTARIMRASKVRVDAQLTVAQVLGGVSFGRLGHYVLENHPDLHTTADWINDWPFPIVG